MSKAILVKCPMCGIERLVKDFRPMRDAGHCRSCTQLKNWQPLTERRCSQCKETKPTPARLSFPFYAIPKEQ